MKKLLTSISTGTLFLSAGISTAFAALDVDPCITGRTGDVDANRIQQQLCGLNADGAPQLIRNAIVGILVISAVIALFFLIYGGIRWIVSGGDKGKVTEARGMIVAAIVGLVVTFLAYFILSVVLQLFGLNINQLAIPSLVPGTTTP